MESLKEKTAKGLLWGATNQLLTQLLSALLGIILARLLTPADYGLVGMLSIFTAIAVSLQESGFTAALTNMKTVSHRDFNAVFWFSSSVSIVLYAILFFSAPLIARFFHQPVLVSLSRVVFLAFVFGGLGVAHAAYLFRNMMNREKMIAGLVSLLGSSAIGLTLAFNGYSYWSLAWQQVAYIVIADIGRLYYVKWRPTLDFDFSPIRKMFRFSSKILATNILNQLTNNLLSFIFGRLFPAQHVGNYTQAAKWSTMGHSLITGTIAQVAQPVFSSISGEEERQRNAFRKMLRFTSFVAFPAMLGLSLVADFIIILIGEEWADSVPLLRLLCISGAFIPLQSLYHSLFISHNRSDIYMRCSVALMVLQVAVVLAFSNYGIETMVAAYVTLMVAWTGVWMVLAKVMLGLRLTDSLKDIVPFLLTAAACVAIGYFCTRGITQHILRIMARILLVAVLYIASMKVTKAQIFDECMSYIYNKVRKSQ